MKEVSIHLRPLPSSDWITHDPAFGTSILCIKAEADKHDGPLTIVSVHHEGVPLRHRVVDACTVIVSPRIPLRGERLEVRCLTPDSPPKPLHAIPASTPPPMSGYGLQRPTDRHMKANQ
jgi:hypothetical protein